MFRKKIPVLYLFLAAVSGSLVSVSAVRYMDKKSEPVVAAASAADQGGDCQYTISRLEGYKYIQPVYMAEPKCESRNFVALKSDISDYIESVKPSGDLEYASVYLKDLNTNDWMDVNPDLTYHPGSLFKVVTMTTFLRMAETNLSMLDKEVVCPMGLNPPDQTFTSKEIVPGNKYKIKDLLYYMIVYSDNHATMLLHKYMHIGLFEKAFTDLGLEKPNVYDNKYVVSVKDYSKFVSVLYDGGYLTIPASEFAISLLCESDFNMGLTKELPKTLKIAHKFGEAGKPGDRELHECAIVYLNNRPYLLTIMTKGKQSEKLAEIISHISKLVYDQMVAKPV